MNTSKTILTAIGLIVGSTICVAGEPEIGPPIRANQDNSGLPQNETTIASTDFDPSRVLAGWNDYRNGGGARNGFALSTDSGLTWADFLLRPPPAFRAGTEGDPMTAYDNRTGTLWAGGIAFSGNGGLFTARLEPDSTTFEPVVMAALNANSPSGFIDKGWMAAGPDINDPDNVDKVMLYAAYNDGLIRSADRGDTWSNPLNLGGGLGFLPRVGPNGELYIQYWSGGNQILLRRSFNNGQTVSPALLVATRMDVWGVDGTRFPGNFRVPPINAFAVDPNDGTLYVVYFDTTNIVGANRNVDLYFTKSTNQGTSWTTPEIINQMDSNPPGDSFFPWIEVDQTGRIHMVFHDSRNVAPQSDDSGADGFFDAFYSYSDDAGVSWTEARLSPTSFNSANDGFGGLFMGDYSGLALGGTTAYPLYVSTQNGEADAFVHTITTSAACTADFAPPEGVLDFFDVSTFLNLFSAEDPSADLNADGLYDFFDVQLYLAAFAVGCP